MNGIDVGAKPPAEAPTTGAAARSLLPRIVSEPGELIDRIHKLRTLLPAFAQEIVAARGEAARLRSPERKAAAPDSRTA